MLTLSIASLYSIINQFFWPMLRVLALFSTAPIFNEKGIGKKTKVGLATIIALLIGQNLPNPHIEIFSISGLWVGAQQFIIGASIGLVIQLIFVAVRNAGEIIGLQMGLSFATFFDPAAGGNMPVIARILNLLVTLLFLTFNGHLWMLSILADSFILLPISTNTLNPEGFIYFPHIAGLVFRFGLMLGLPIITLLLCLNLTLGLLNRLTPQLSIFVVGFPLTLSVGMAAMSMIMYTLAPFFENMMKEIFEHVSQMIILLS
ncbi:MULTISPECIES: flagellar biosynthetic protein FliR [Yersinia]|uniref:flagellar biosynthetic protein FliR n=1 Tax=Yersinia TaxID=629 RepID=UPI0005E1C769|nr:MULTISPECIES: flagellar biosynthetic protein FliR [Yersinia]OVZ98644.1 flagellar biosynthetic protein FliR [Yersinia frederiksenii]RXA94441.1 flagellar type III secretion system protein FliR [Yersinia sp. 2105 StPb PI]CNI13805.1 flagellar biosynthesis protein FliR [Yersinia frederiksenii]CNI44971.1 flagellar biosynthesis protein FliR [Yersinia frederiksenii]CNK70008.1 flagellar biosynthesis protein FliR [Yersinia frederiksenii]